MSELVSALIFCKDDNGQTGLTADIEQETEALNAYHVRVFTHVRIRMSAPRSCLSSWGGTFLQRALPAAPAIIRGLPAHVDHMSTT